MMSSSHSRSPRREDIATVDHIEKSLMKVEGYLVSKNEEIRGLRELIKFIQNLRRRLPVHTAAEQFELLQPLRQWLFWLPVCYFQRAKGSSTVLIVLAHFYAVALAVEPLFPAVGAAYFGSLSISPIEKIRQALSLSQSARSAGGHVLDYGTTPLSLMDFPLQKVAEFRQRLGWARQQLQQQHQQQQTQQQQQQSAAYAYDSLLNATNPLTLSSQASTYSSPSYSSGASDSSSMIISPESISFAGRPRFLESPGQHSGGHLYSTTTATTSPFPYSPLSNSPAFSVADQSAVDYATLDYATAAVTAQGAYAPSASVWT